MTLIVGLIHDGIPYLASDSCSSNGYTYNLTAGSKLFVNGGLSIGYTSSFRMAQLLEYSFAPPKRPKDTPALTYLARDVVPSLRKLFKEGGYGTVTHNEETGGQFLVVLDEQLFTVQSDFSVSAWREPFAAVGSGEQAALGALWATDGLKLPPEQRLLLALEAAESVIPTVRSPFYLMAGAEVEPLERVYSLTSPG
ncbi:hypothetical protein [Deinococcus aquatilis]|uniref:hypothetical protein n=1 Tax=Deinococcus aquatilis TaxID=519440 RepID=UPI00037F12C0|nr:hypothetical protein [Deinococcus aquatilis]